MRASPEPWNGEVPDCLAKSGLSAKELLVRHYRPPNRERNWAVLGRLPSGISYAQLGREVGLSRDYIKVILYRALRLLGFPPPRDRSEAMRMLEVVFQADVGVSE